MADISKITLPSNVTYDVKDTTARSGLANKQDKITAITAQTTQAVYPIKIDSQGHITAYGSAVTIPAAVAVKGNSESTYRTGNVNLTAANIGAAAASHTHSANDLTAGYVNIHPENSPVIIPFMHNDIGHLLRRGGSASVTKDGAAWSVDINNCFDGTGSYWAINPTGITTIVIELTLHKTFGWTNTIYVDFGSGSWRAKSIKIEVMNTNYSGDTWTQKYSTTTNSIGHIYVTTSHTPTGASDAGGGFNKIRLTFSSWQTATGFRISQIGVYNYGSLGLRETYMSRGVDDYVFRNITPNTNNAYSLGSSSLKWKDVYTGTLNGTTIPSSPKFTDTTYGADRGISNVSGNFGHSNTAITAQNTQAVYPIKIDAYGHITGYGSAVTIPAAVAVKGNSESTYRTGNVNLTAANIGAAASSHAHGNITSGGDITATATIEAGDRLVINDESASKITNSSLTFGASTTNYLRNDGTWNIPEKGTMIYNRTGSSATKHTVLDFTSIASGTGRSVDMMTTIDLLWTNASPGSGFAEQDVSVNASNYRFLLIIFRLATDGRITSQMCKVDESMGWSMSQVNPGSNCLVRRNYQVFSGHIHFNNAANSGTYANSSSATSYLVPLYIYGIK